MNIQRRYFKQILIILILIITMTPGKNTFARTANSTLATQGEYIVVEMEHSQVLQKSNSEKETNSSLLNRLMTCLIALEKKSVTEKIKPKADSVSTTERFRLNSNSEYSVDFLIRATMLGYADNTARVLAESISATEQEFVQLMNDKAKQFGMLNTFFANVDGSPNELQHTTLYDTFLFIKNAMKNQQFYNIFKLEMSLIWDAQVISNSNTLVTEYTSKNTVGGVFGYFNNLTSNACTSIFYIETGTANTSNAMKLMVIVSNVSDETYHGLTNEIIENITNIYVRSLLIKKDDVVFNITVGDEELNLISPFDVYGIVPKDLGNAIQHTSFTFYEGYAPDVVQPPIKAGTIFGTGSLLLKDNSTVQFSIAADRDIDVKKTTVKSFLDRIKEFKEIYVLIMFLIGLETLILLLKLTGLILSKVNR